MYAFKIKMYGKNWLFYVDTYLRKSLHTTYIHEITFASISNLMKPKDLLFQIKQELKIL